MLHIDKKEHCCGCAACYSICPKNCITMQVDEEGFLYPAINAKDCINCDLCVRTCPSVNPTQENIVEQQAFIIQHGNPSIRKGSTSGGAFTAIAEYVIQQKGVVFGAAMNSDLKVFHKYVEIESELSAFRNSKYVQSVIGDTFKQAKSFLKQGRMVCFSGTPCQIEGLHLFLDKEYQNLITVDVVCRAVPSPKIFEKYLAYQEERLKAEVSNVRFRDKTYYGYQYSQMLLEGGVNNDILYHGGIESDKWLRTFFSNICNRPSCYQCIFKKRYRLSDFTLWDCFNPKKINKEMDDNMGTTCMLLHSEKARELFANIRNRVKYCSVNPDSIVQGVTELTNTVTMNRKRSTFFLECNNMKPSEFFDKYFPDSLSVKCERIIRILTYKMGLYQGIRNLYVLLFGNKKR